MLFSRQTVLKELESAILEVLKQRDIALYHAKKGTGWDFILQKPTSAQLKACDEAIAMYSVAVGAAGKNGRWTGCNVGGLWPLKLRMVDGDHARAGSKSMPRDRKRAITLSVIECARVQA